MLSSLKKVADKAIILVKSNLLGVVAGIVIIYLLMNYGSLKSSMQSGMTTGENAPVMGPASSPTASIPDNEYQQYRVLLHLHMVFPLLVPSNQLWIPKSYSPKMQTVNGLH